MNQQIVDVVVRHPKERLSKCSLTPLQGRKDLQFFRANPGFSFDATGYLLLDLDAPVISKTDGSLPILLLDSTWKLLPTLMNCIAGSPVRRSLPRNLETAYPRKSKIEPDPMGGLASVEALFAARMLMGRGTSELLDDYYWKGSFLDRNNFLKNS